MHIYRNFIFLLISFFISNILIAQFDSHPELEWFTIETEHFYIHYHKGTERTANVAAKIAEEIYGPVTTLYNYRPKKKTSLIINDESDYSNGATDYFGNRIEIASVALDFDLRGTHNWLRNVITHEFIHIIQIQSALKFSDKIPSVYLQFLGYEDERRPDVLYGYPNVIISYPISGVGVPAWFAEGTSQYQRQQLNYDNWDAHRDMILRMRALDNQLLSWNEMGQFASVTTYKAESIYNQGFGLVRYITEKYGEDKLKEISNNMSNPLTLNSESAFKKAIGKSGSELYDEWKVYLKNDYKIKTESLKQFLVEGQVLAKEGFANYNPKFSPDIKSVTYLSNKTYDYGSTSLFIHNLEKQNEDKLLITSVSGGYGWSPDGKRIIFARRNKPTIHQKSVFDLYVFDIEKEKETQITFSLRAHSPSYSSDGERICFVTNHDGTQNLFISKNPGTQKVKEMTQLTNFNNGEQIYSPEWSPDGKYIIFDYSKNSSRSIARVETENVNFEFLFESPDADFRSPVYSNDGKYIYFASDLTGIYNIYRFNIENELNTLGEKIEQIEQITNVLGGAFMPDTDTLGNLVYSLWTSDGYKIYLLKQITPLDTTIAEKNAIYIRPERVIHKYFLENDSNSAHKKNKFSWTSLRNFDDSNPVIKESGKYNNTTTPLFIIPVLRFDNYSKTGKFLDVIKPGLYFYSQDVLGKMGIFGGASINLRLERDLFLQFDYNNGVPFFKDLFLKKLGFVPNFQLAGYNVTRKTDASLVAGIDTIPLGITYDLLQFDFNMAFKIINANHNMRFGFSISRYSSKFDAFLIPNTGITVPATSTNYFNGRDLSLTYSFTNFTPSKNDDINPIGRYARLRYDYEFNSLNPELEVDQNTGIVMETYSKANFHRLEGEWFESIPLFNSHSLSLRLKGGSILGPEQDNFFDFYISGFPGMKGYPFYSLGGNEYFTANLTYRFPVVENLDFKFLQFYFDKIYFSIYGDFGNAWNGDATKLSDFKKDVGAELRIQSFSYYVYPTSIAFNAAYGIDKFSRIFPTISNDKKEVTYGKEWRFYFTMLFGFDFFIENFKKLRF